MLLLDSSGTPVLHTVAHGASLYCIRLPTALRCTAYSHFAHLPVRLHAVAFQALHCAVYTAEHCIALHSTALHCAVYTAQHCIWTTLQCMKNMRYA